MVIDVRHNDSDPDGDSLTTPSVVTIPNHGGASVNPDGTITYTPDPGYTGTDTFTYVICDIATPKASVILLLCTSQFILY